MLTLTTWNIKWFGQLLQGMTRTLPRHSEPVESDAGRALQRRQRAQIAEEIRLINPDILCLQEAPSTGNVARLQAFCDDELEGRWSVVTRPPGEPYHVLGSQGIFFLVKTARRAELQPALLPVSRWREATTQQSKAVPGEADVHGEDWPVNHPWFKPDGDRPELDVTFGDAEAGEAALFPSLTERRHKHYRQPQALVCTIGGRRVDFIGVHLKSKFAGDDYDRAGRARQKTRPTAEDLALIQSVEQVAVEARIKLTTEIVNIRHFIEHRFQNEPHPAVFVLGDLNDGVGKEYFERRYLFHDLISNLQGDVFLAQRFLNHALFDFGMNDGDNYRWTVRFEDAWDPQRDPRILLDHIMFTQSVTGAGALDRAAVRVPAGAGRVEHDIHAAVNAVFDSESDFTSDHRPVSVDLETAGPVG